MTIEQIKKELDFNLECENEVLAELQETQKEIEIKVNEQDLYTTIKVRCFQDNKEVSREELTLTKSGGYLQSTVGTSTKDFCFKAI